MKDGPIVRVGPWTLDPATGELRCDTARRRLEPKSADLLVLLASAPSRVFSKEEIFEAIWPGVTVAEDTLARAISKLRKALEDDPKTPRFIETIPKRGYRLIAEAAENSVAVRPFKWKIAAALACAVLAAIGVTWMMRAPKGPQTDSLQLISRADDFYFQYTMQDNEAAIALYERIVEVEPENAKALAGLANALVQRAMRWPTSAADTGGEYRSLGDALASGRLTRPEAQRHVQRALGLAQEAVRQAPGDAYSYKALGFVLSADGQMDAALAQYESALAIDSDAWGVLINVGDILEISGRASEALPYFERAYAAMDKAYDTEPARILPWQSRLGVTIAQRMEAGHDTPSAEHWYRKVLSISPLDPGATRALARLVGGEEAALLCADLARGTGGLERCEGEGQTAEE